MGNHKQILFFSLESGDGPFNMGLDKLLCENPPPVPLLRLYTWEPETLSLGRFQTYTQGELLSSKLALTRRLSGGGAIFHDRGELTYSLSGHIEDFNTLLSSSRLYSNSPSSSNSTDIYFFVHKAWIYALERFAGLRAGSLWMPVMKGAEEVSSQDQNFLCFTRRSHYDVLGNCKDLVSRNHSFRALYTPYLPKDLPAEGKIIGSAQRKRGQRILLHGSIKLNPGPLSPWALSLAEIAGHKNYQFSEIVQKVAALFAESLEVKLVPWEFHKSQLQKAKYYAQEFFASKDWVEQSKKPRINKSLNTI